MPEHSIIDVWRGPEYTSVFGPAIWCKLGGHIKEFVIYIVEISKSEISSRNKGNVFVAYYP